MNDPRPDLHNDALHRCIRELAKTRDTASRHNVYLALIRARLILLVSGDTPGPIPACSSARPSGGSPLHSLTLGRSEPCCLSSTTSCARCTPHPLEHHGGAPVFAIFTSWDALDAFSPTPQTHRLMPGTELFPHVTGHRAGLLMINPGGELGGELYGHELITICEGIERLRR